MKKFSSSAGVTLIEILIGIVISVIMMAAMFTSYNAVNNTYSQVIDKAKSSQTGRDVVGMLIKDIRLAGYFHIDDVRKRPTNYAPILITSTNSDCDKIELIHGDREIKLPITDPAEYNYETFKITYECKDTTIMNKKTNKKEDVYAIFKSKSKWDGSKWDYMSDDKTFKEELIVDYINAIEFIPVDEAGKRIEKIKNLNDSNKIKVIEIKITIRSKNEFYKKVDDRNVLSLGPRKERWHRDKFLRDAVIATAHTRNMGLE